MDKLHETYVYAKCSIISYFGNDTSTNCTVTFETPRTTNESSIKFCDVQYTTDEGVEEFFTSPVKLYLLDNKRVMLQIPLTTHQDNHLMKYKSLYSFIDMSTCVNNNHYVLSKNSLVQVPLVNQDSVKFIYHNTTMCGSFSNCTIKFDFDGNRRDDPVNFEGNIHSLDLSVAVLHNSFFYLNRPWYEYSEFQTLFHVNHAGRQRNLTRFLPDKKLMLHKKASISSSNNFFGLGWSVDANNNVFSFFQYNAKGKVKLNTTLTLTIKKNYTCSGILCFFSIEPHNTHNGALARIYNLPEGGMLVFLVKCPTMDCTGFDVVKINKDSKLEDQTAAVDDIINDCKLPPFEDLYMDFSVDDKQFCIHTVCTVERIAQTFSVGDSVKLRSRCVPREGIFYFPVKI
ncbi:uncharacterized protein LOC111643662 [Copidosoma floridanum]|nr:uncharacterized protein LOC111643662 [Copidosoma floridanum]